ncbi:MAG: PAS domain-containing sensor histidine kinase, partial [Sphingomonadales bacterium]
MLRARTRIANDRRTMGLSVLFSAVIMGTILEAALMPVPVIDLQHGLVIVLLALLGGSGAAGLVWSWRTRPHAQIGLERRELMDAVELAAVMV